MTRNVINHSTVIWHLMLFLVMFTSTAETTGLTTEQQCGKANSTHHQQDINDPDSNPNFTFYSPNFPEYYYPDSYCVYKFIAADNYVIDIKWDVFDLEPKDPNVDECINDYIVIFVTDYNGREHLSNPICGNQLPPRRSTMQKSIGIIFKSSSSQEHTGFQGVVSFSPEKLRSAHKSTNIDGCGGSAANNGKRGGEIVSPGYPNAYPGKITCNWLIRVDEDSQVFVKLIDLQLTETVGSGCKKASLEIIDGYAHHEGGSSYHELLESKQRVEFCGEKRYFRDGEEVSFISDRNRLHLNFTTTEPPSSEMIEKTKNEGLPLGFRIIWTAVKTDFEETGCPGGFICRGGEYCIREGIQICGTKKKYCIDKSLVCDGIYNCGNNDLSDEENCSAMEVVVVCCSLFAGFIVLMTVLICVQQRRKKRQVEQRTRRICDRLNQQTKQSGNEEERQELNADKVREKESSSDIEIWKEAAIPPPEEQRSLKLLDQSPSARYKRVNAQAMNTLPSYHKDDKDIQAKEPFLTDENIHATASAIMNHANQAKFVPPTSKPSVDAQMVSDTKARLRRVLETPKFSDEVELEPMRPFVMRSRPQPPPKPEAPGFKLSKPELPPKQEPVVRLQRLTSQDPRRPLPVPSPCVPQIAINENKSASRFKQHMADESPYEAGVTLMRSPEIELSQPHLGESSYRQDIPQRPIELSTFSDSSMIAAAHTPPPHCLSEATTSSGGYLPYTTMPRSILKNTLTDIDASVHASPSKKRSSASEAPPKPPHPGVQIYKPNKAEIAAVVVPTCRPNIVTIMPKVSKGSGAPRYALSSSTAKSSSTQSPQKSGKQSSQSQSTLSDAASISTQSFHSVPTSSISTAGKAVKSVQFQEPSNASTPADSNLADDISSSPENSSPWFPQIKPTSV